MNWYSLMPINRLMLLGFILMFFGFLLLPVMIGFILMPAGIMIFIFGLAKAVYNAGLTAYRFYGRMKDLSNRNK